MTTEPLKETILRFLARHSTEQFKPAVLARRLSMQGQDDFRVLQQTLNELFQAGAIERHERKRYGHAAPPVSQRMEGIFRNVRQGGAMVELLPPAEGMVSISSRFRGTALAGDRVSVVVFAEQGNLRGKGPQSAPVREGEVVEVLERSGQPIVGVFGKGKHFSFISPDDRAIGRDVLIPKGKTMGARPGQKVVAQIESWESLNLSPEGKIIEILGQSGEVHAEMAAVAREFRLPLHFPKEVMAEAEKIQETIPTGEIRKRTDLRNLLCFTIDPEDAKDFDDAVSLEITSDKNFRLGVHIADVSHYVQEGSVLDTEALSRGTSVYLADDVIPMLPEKLSNNLCSLRPKVDRLAYSVFMLITPKGLLKEHEITRSVIHSKRRFTYEEVQQVIETGKGDCADVIKQMHGLSRMLLQKRLREGSIDFESVETKFRFDDHGKPTEIIKKARLDAHRLVEEFMLMANQTVAKHIGLVRSEDDLRPFIYRIHDAPPPEKLADLASFVEHLGHHLNISGGVTPKALQKLLAEIKGTDEEIVINEVALRSMAKATYSVQNIGHFGLGFQYYTHFTSPIRRYPDLIIHRLLNEYQQQMPHRRREQLAERLPDICDQSSKMERNAQSAERASVKVMQVEYMKRHLGETFHAIISGVTNFGFFVEISDLGVEGLIRVRDMEDDYYVFDEKRYSMTGRRTKKRYRLGDKVTIQVVRVDPEEREIDFMMVHPPENVHKRN
jgi:ribonuclease R